MINIELDHPENYKGIVKFARTILKKSWEAKQKYEYVNIAIDLTELDPQGTLQIVTKMDKDSCKQIPQVKIVDGHLIMAVRREICN
jgi:hypothetical protein